jgi:hypothetical protein
MRIQLEDGSSMQWAATTQTKWINVLTKDVVDAMVEFWTNETRVSLNKKDIMKHCIMKNIWEKHATHFLEEPQVHVLPFFNLIMFTMF